MADGAQDERREPKRRLVTLSIDGREVQASDRATILDRVGRQGSTPGETPSFRAAE